jgi:hypothetical protein
MGDGGLDEPVVLSHDEVAGAASDVGAVGAVGDVPRIRSWLRGCRWHP